VVEGLLEVEMWVEEMVVEEEETVAVEEVVDVIVEVGEVGEVILTVLLTVIFDHRQKSPYG
jgi:hypothetical protein